MISLFWANLAAVGSARGRHCKFGIRASAAITATALLTASMPATVPLAGRDPADPAAKVAGVGYKSTIAPYTSLRPSSPAPWRERNDRPAPEPKSDR